MDMEFDTSGIVGFTDLVAGMGSGINRAAGKVNGQVADEVAAEADAELASRGWSREHDGVDTVRARRSSEGPNNPDAYVFLDAGASWHEFGTSQLPPQPIVSPPWDRLTANLDQRMADELARWV